MPNALKWQFSQAMKKLTTILLISVLLCISLFSCAGCTPSFQLDYAELTTSVKQVYVVVVSRVGYWGYISKTLLKEFVGQDFDNILVDLCKLSFNGTTSGRQPEHNVGMAFMLVCDNNDCDYIIVGPNGIEKFKDGDQTHFQVGFCNAKQFEALIDKYYS